MHLSLYDSISKDANYNNTNYCFRSMLHVPSSHEFFTDKEIDKSDVDLRVGLIAQNEAFNVLMMGFVLSFVVLGNHFNTYKLWPLFRNKGDLRVSVLSNFTTGNMNDVEIHIAPIDMARDLKIVLKSFTKGIKISLDLHLKFSEKFMDDDENLSLN